MTNLRENYLENEDFRNLDFEGKVKFVLDDVKSWWNDTAKPKVESWWLSTGEPWAIDMGTLIGQAMYTGIVGGMKGGLGVVGGMKDAFNDPSVGSIGSAAIGTLLAGSIASMLLSPLLKSGKVAVDSGKWMYDKGKKIHGWNKNRKGGGPSSPSAPPNAPASKNYRAPNDPQPYLPNPKGKQPKYGRSWFGEQPHQVNEPNTFKNAKQNGGGFLSKALGWGKNEFFCCQ
ncbi:hypothetical protein [Virgibacillus sp. 7505]|uniref:hypothetical protein n=1 Tax=Virgibacillus sp. 7505 TaxID=2022548 RepID=UPI0025712671|nr:hypothetical protein [Virgibacillus sp. 7505]